jgi:hypothetical protein
MEIYREEIHNFTWEQLLKHIGEILAKDKKALEANVSYYKKLLNDSNADKAQINRLFEKLQLDKLRYECFSELFFRIDETKYKFIIMSLESCIQQDRKVQGVPPKDWVATVRFENNHIKVYFMALSYFQ